MLKKSKVLPRFELRLLDSKSKVLTNYTIEPSNELILFSQFADHTALHRLLIVFVAFEASAQRGKNIFRK
jgi:hypothetical protein